MRSTAAVVRRTIVALQMSSAAEDVLTSAGAGGKVIRGSVLRVAGNGVGILAGLATATLLLRHLGVAESGRYVTVLSLVAIASSVVDLGLNVSASRELALREVDGRRALMANILGQRLWITPIALLAIVSFAVLAGYPPSMQIGAAMAGVGLYAVALGDALLLPLTVELRNAGLAFVDFLKQAVALACVALLVALGAQPYAVLRRPDRRRACGPGDHAAAGRSSRVHTPAPGIGQSSGRCSAERFHWRRRSCSDRSTSVS